MTIPPGYNLIQGDGNWFVTQNNFISSWSWQWWFNSLKERQGAFQGKEIVQHSLITDDSLQKGQLSPFGTKLPSGTGRAFPKSRNESWLLVPEKTASVPSESHGTLTIEKTTNVLLKRVYKYQCWGDVMLFLCVRTTSQFNALFRSLNNIWLGKFAVQISSDLEGGFLALAFHSDWMLLQRCCRK